MSVFTSDSLLEEIHDLSSRFLKDPLGDTREILERIPQALITHGLMANLFTGLADSESDKANFSAPDSFESGQYLRAKIVFLRSLGTTIVRSQLFLYLGNLRLSSSMVAKLNRENKFTPSNIISYLTEITGWYCQHPVRFLRIHSECLTIPALNNIPLRYTSLRSIASDQAYGINACIVTLQNKPNIRRYLKYIGYLLRESSLRIFYIPGNPEEDDLPRELSSLSDPAALSVYFYSLDDIGRINTLIEASPEGITRISSMDMLPVYIDMVSHIHKVLLTLSAVNPINIYYEKYREGTL